jgi:hypothetical protein
MYVTTHKNLRVTWGVDHFSAWLEQPCLLFTELVCKRGLQDMPLMPSSFRERLFKVPSDNSSGTQFHPSTYWQKIVRAGDYIVAAS